MSKRRRWTHTDRTQMKEAIWQQRADRERERDRESDADGPITYGGMECVNSICMNI